MQPIQQIAHGQAQLHTEIRTDNAQGGNVRVFGGKVESVAIENARASRGAGRLVQRTDGFALGQIGSRDAAEHNMAAAGQARYLKRAPSRRVPELEEVL